MYPSLALFVWLLGLSQGPPVPQAGPPPPTPDEIRHQLLEAVNAERAAAGAGPLRLREALNGVAQQNAEEARDHQGAMYDEASIPRIQGRLRQAG